MKNVCDLELYFVEAGTALPGNTEEDWDGFDKILVAATSGEAALAVGDLYKQGKVIADNLKWGGQTIKAVFYQNPITGLFL